MTGTTPASIVAPSHRNIWPERHWRFSISTRPYDKLSYIVYLLIRWYADCMIPRRWQAVAEQKTSRSKLDGQGAQWPVPNASRKRRFGNGRLCGVRLSCLRWIRPIFRITAISGNWILMIYPNYWAIAGLKGRLKSKDTCLVYSGVFSSDRLQWFLHAGAL